MISMLLDSPLWHLSVLPLWRVGEGCYRGRSAAILILPTKQQRITIISIPYEPLKILIRCEKRLWQITTKKNWSWSWNWSRYSRFWLLVWRRPFDVTFLPCTAGCLATAKLDIQLKILEKVRIDNDICNNDLSLLVSSSVIHLPTIVSQVSCYKNYKWIYTHEKLS